MHHPPHPPENERHFLISLLVSIGAYSNSLIIHCAVHVRTVVESAIPSLDRPAPALIHEVPMKACKGPVLVTFVLEKGFALFHSEFLQVPGSYM